MASNPDRLSFGEHLDVLRAAIVKIAAVAVVFGVAAFCFKEELFAIILAPKETDFITYRLLYSLNGLVTEADAPDFLVKLINTGLAEQFIIHMKAALYAGILCASPYILYQLSASCRRHCTSMSENMWYRSSEADMRCSPWAWQ